MDHRQNRLEKCFLVGYSNKNRVVRKKRFNPPKINSQLIQLYAKKTPQAW